VVNCGVTGLKMLLWVCVVVKVGVANVGRNIGCWVCCPKGLAGVVGLNIGVVGAIGLNCVDYWV